MQSRYIYIQGWESVSIRVCEFVLYRSSRWISRKGFLTFFHCLCFVFLPPYFWQSWSKFRDEEVSKKEGKKPSEREEDSLRLLLSELNRSTCQRHLPQAEERKKRKQAKQPREEKEEKRMKDKEIRRKQDGERRKKKKREGYDDITRSQRMSSWNERTRKRSTPWRVLQVYIQHISTLFFRGGVADWKTYSNFPFFLLST